MRQTVVLEAYHVIITNLFDRDFGDYRLRFLGRVLAARLGIKSLDDLHFFEHLLERHAEQLCQIGQLMSLQAFEMVAHHLDRKPITETVIVELNQQRFAHVARGAPDGVQPLHDGRRLFNDFDWPRAHRGDLFNRRIQEAGVLVQIADDRFAGDPNSQVGDRYYGYLIYAGGY